MKLHRWTAVFLLAILFNINRRQQITACGQLQNVLESRITFGHETHRWPWHAAIYHRYNETEFTYKCGGTLASSKFVLTAAHCVSIEVERMRVSLGRLYLNASPSSAPYIKISEKLTHPNYNPENYANDIAIITLTSDAIFNSYIQPICMWRPSKMDLSEVIGKFGTVVGWGFTENAETSNVLQEASLPVVSSFTCLESNRDLFGLFLTSANFCAGTQNGTSVCTGDSGGSITFEESGRFYLRGIVSVGANRLADRSANKYMCDSLQYAIFTDAAEYLPWIREKIECEEIVKCEVPSLFDTCIVFLEDPECKLIFDDNSSVATAEVRVTGDGSSAVPDISSVVDKFMKLERLRLYHFKLVKRSRLSPLKNVVELSLDNFSFTEFDVDTFVDLNSLEDFSILDSNLTTLPAGIFRSNNKIRSLYLTRNHMRELHIDVFENLRNIEELSLEDNELDTLPANIFRNNEKMLKILLRLNRIREVHQDLFKGLTNLVELDLSDNRIEYLPSDVFRTNVKLDVVLLSNNSINVIELSLTTMPQLALFELQRNVCIDENFDFSEQSLSEADKKIQRACANPKLK